MRFLYLLSTTQLLKNNLVFADVSMPEAPPPPPGMDDVMPEIPKDDEPEEPVRELEPEPPIIEEKAPEVEPVITNSEPVSEPEPVAAAPVVQYDALGNVIEKETEAQRNRRFLREKVEENQDLKKSGHQWQIGAWMYGDYAHGVIHDDHLTAHGCADHCEKDDQCYHWVYYLDSGRCDMKTNGGSIFTDTDHMIVGHAKRYLSYERELKAKEATEKKEL